MLDGFEVWCIGDRSLPSVFSMTAPSDTEVSIHKCDGCLKSSRALHPHKHICASKALLDTVCITHSTCSQGDVRNLCLSEND